MKAINLKGEEEYCVDVINIYETPYGDFYFKYNPKFDDLNISNTKPNNGRIIYFNENEDCYTNKVGE